ncbi:MAG: 50S ribosomal protein L30 [Thermofilaceae archaeon]|nr:50S ribosomal protein L30 [Thermofilaceae archaeon]MCX8180632.1 50S ribosomal protein L30 [Thermofilaceae archaeon]
MGLLAVIRIRGSPDKRPEERKTLALLRLYKRFHCVLVHDTPDIRGMLKNIEYTVTYGEVDVNTLAEVLQKRGRLIGNKRLTLEYLKEMGFENFEDLASALIEGRIKINDLPHLKPIFRLHPPKGGFKGSLKKHYNEGGELGYRKVAINELLQLMT